MRSSCIIVTLERHIINIKKNMSFWAQMRKNSLKIWSFPAQNVNQRVIFTKSNQISSSSSRSSSSLLKLKCGGSGYNSGRKKGGRNGSFLDLLLEGPLISCGFVAVGSSLGLFYWSFLCDDGDSLVCYADSGSSTAETEKKPKFIFKDAYRRKVFFKYEKRLRTQSPPTKVFEYFASFRSPSGEVFMTPADLMRAVVPVFPPSEAGRIRGGFLKGEPIPGELYCAPSEFFMLFDTNGDGLISFPEYIFFVTLLSIPETSFSVAFKMFDLDNDGGIDKQEFKKVMGLMRKQSKHGGAPRNNRDGIRFGMKDSGGDPVEDGGLLEYFFGKDGQGRLEHEKFSEFLRDLHDEIMRLEFAHYDCKSQGTISAKDFALSMVASADMSHINKFLDRVDELDHEAGELSSIRITFDEFQSFAELRKMLQPFSLAIFSYGKANGLLTKDDLQRAASQVCGISLTKNIIDMVFYMFDEDCDGNLSSTEFLRVLQQKESQISQSKEAGFTGLFSCWSECTKSDRGTFKVPL